MAMWVKFFCKVCRYETWEPLPRKQGVQGPRCEDCLTSLEQLDGIRQSPPPPTPEQPEQEG